MTDSQKALRALDRRLQRMDEQQEHVPQGLREQEEQLHAELLNDRDSLVRRIEAEEKKPS